MSVRKRLTLLFILIAGSLLLAVFLYISWVSSDYRKTEFISRLEDKANSSARLLLEVEEVDSALLVNIEEKRLGQLINERVLILDPAGNSLYSTDSANSLGITSAIIDDLKSSQTVFIENGETEVLGSLYRYKGKDYFVFAGAIDKFGKRKVTYLNRTLTVVWIIAVLLFAVSGWYFSRRAMKPVDDMTTQVDAIQVKNIRSRLIFKDQSDELTRLAKTFNQLLDRVEASVLTEQTFVANASHEIRNPLTVIISQLEVSLLKERDNAEYVRTIQSVLEDMRDLKDVSNKLLVLAQSYKDEKNHYNDCAFDQLVLESIDDCIKANPSLSADIDISPETVGLKTNANEMLMKKAISNIVENASKYSNEKIRIKLDRKTNGFFLTVKDNGLGISNEDLPNVFNPFFRGKNAHNIKGHGIGLSLVKRIIDHHKGKIEILSEPGKGTLVSIWIPFSDAIS